MNETEGAEKRQLLVGCKLTQLSSQEGQGPRTRAAMAPGDCCLECLPAEGRARHGSQDIVLLSAQAMMVTVGVLSELNVVTGQHHGCCVCQPLSIDKAMLGSLFFFFSGQTTSI